jgi:ubiquinone/menaquinone biosynthesis C-methylase UbiE
MLDLSKLMKHSPKKEMDNALNQVSRVQRPKMAARKLYDPLSRWYDTLARSEQKNTRHGLELLAAQPGEGILDLGCGTGSALLILDNITGSSAHLVGCDLSLGMLTAAQRKYKRRRSLGSIDLMCADACALPILTDSFNGLLMSFTLELFDTPIIPAVLTECIRILKPGGRLAVVALAKTKKPGLMERSYEWLHTRCEQIADCRPIYTSYYVEQAGFYIRQHHRTSMWGLPVDILLAVKPGLEDK